LIKKNATNESSGMVIVKHPNGFMSVYIGLKPNNKPMFSKISAGDSIGTTYQYTEHTNKNNIHIELYEKGRAVDMLEKVDLSLLGKENVPSRYGWKYIDDIKKIKQKINLTELQKSIKFFYVE
jgi:murein DD-endopeptidase MepM/ murein hydrolase activator NlpD